MTNREGAEIMSNREFNFNATDLNIEETGPIISEMQINACIPELFPGKDGLIRFYLTFNGAWFGDYGAIYSSPNGGEFQILFFYAIPSKSGSLSKMLPSLVDARTDFYVWRQKHYPMIPNHYLPFADNGSGDEFWLDLVGGEIFYFSHEEFTQNRELVPVAPNFHAFVANLKANDYEFD
jgi:SMI1 / KNR4 family (SUKH-1)